MPEITVIKPGVQSLLVDQGRLGYGDLGISQGGPIDEDAFYWLNRLLDNDGKCAAIECLIGGLVLQINCTQVIAVTGS